jgi:hypothetical protein
VNFDDEPDYTRTNPADIIDGVIAVMFVAAVAAMLFGWI